ncbi:MAG: hypothetical protein JSW60_07265 [Thermoplasmatales archaeon]|nr:MAG: hypothetical protein JSW60_07265 [Thermoplasmatales archaeon]
MNGKGKGNMKSFLIVGVVVLTVVTALAVCISSENVSAMEIKMYTLQSSIGINSYEFSIDMIMTTGTDSSPVSMSTTANGAVDVVNHRFVMEMSSEFSTLMEMDFLYYIVDDAIFMKMDYLGSEQWIKMDFSEFNVSWDSYDQMQMQVDLLEYGEVERLNDEIINNEDCYVLKILPDVDKLYEIMMNQQGLSTGVLQGSYLSDIIKDFSIKLWISKETNFIMKAYEYVAMEMTMHEYTTSMTTEITIQFTNYNTAISIELPEDAENATSYLDIFSTISPA